MTGASLGATPYWYGLAGVTAEILAEDEAFCSLRMENPSEVSTPPHLDAREQETILVLNGVLVVERESRTVALSPGNWITLPRDCAHRLGNPGLTEARYLAACSPPSLEAFVRQAGAPKAGAAGSGAMPGADVKRLVVAAPDHGIRLLDEIALEFA